MPFEVYDYRTVNRNVLVTPEIRARLYHMAPGQVDSRHSHDLGHEVFLVLEGLAEFEISGSKRTLGPGEMCVAQADEIHQVRNALDDRPTVMYLSVAPHVHPTHTGRTESGARLPPRYPPNANYNAPQDLTALLDDVAAELEAAAVALAETTAAQASALRVLRAELRGALAQEDAHSAVAVRNRMGEMVRTVHKQVYAFDQVWNALAPRIAQEQD
jgi:quercetin dioxygenase-like cupin family protein